MPKMGEFLTYLKGLRPKNRVGFVFGSYGWGGQALSEIRKMIDNLSWDFYKDNYNVNYVPDVKHLNEIKEIGQNLGIYIKNEGGKK